MLKSSRFRLDCELEHPNQHPYAFGIHRVWAPRCMTWGTRCGVGQLSAPRCRGGAADRFRDPDHPIAHLLHDRYDGPKLLSASAPRCSNGGLTDGSNGQRLRGGGEVTAIGSFRLGVNYWPARTAMYWWDDVRYPEVDRDMARIEDLGLQEARIFLLWEAFQPRPDRVSEERLRSLETVLGAAGRRDVGLVLSLCCRAPRRQAVRVAVQGDVDGRRGRLRRRPG